MPLVRWQFRGLEEKKRKAFLFENVIDVKGKRYTMPVTVGTLAASTEIYALGLQCEAEQIHERWTNAQMRPLAPAKVGAGPAQEAIWQGDDLLKGHGLDMLPVPISTPGFDNAPYLTSANWVTKDPETGTYNIGNYRSQIKAPNRNGGLFLGQHMGTHWQKCKTKGISLEAAIVIGVVPVIAYAATAKLPYDFDEYRLAGGLAGEPIDVIQCKTVDLLVPATAEIVIEGKISTEWIEPEGTVWRISRLYGPSRRVAIYGRHLHHAPARCDLYGADEPVSAKRVEQDQAYRHGEGHLQVSPGR